MSASPRNIEASYLRLLEVSEALLQKVQTPDQIKAIKDMNSDFYYELFMLTRDVQGDVHVCMNYLSKAIDLSEGSNWVYHFEMSLFIKQVNIYGWLIRVGVQNASGCCRHHEEGSRS